MAELTPKTIAELPSAGVHTGAEILPISQGGAAKKTTIADLVYPVGSIYMSVNNANPATLFGGTWQQIQDTFLLAAGSAYAAGGTGGAATHTLTITEMPSHKHNLRGEYGASPNTDYFPWGHGYTQLAGTSPVDELSDNSIEATGGGQAFSIMPPYLAVYVWKRTA